MARKKKILPLIKDDPWLADFTEAIEGRHADATRKIDELTGGTGRLTDFANAHHYYGLHHLPDGRGWVFREWAPNATDICLIGDFNNWRECQPYRLKSTGYGNWEITLPERGLAHGQLYKLLVRWPDGQGERIPAYATRVVQDEQTKIFSAQVWAPEEPYRFTCSFRLSCRSRRLGRLVS